MKMISLMDIVKEGYIDEINQMKEYYLKKVVPHLNQWVVEVRTTQQAIFDENVNREISEEEADYFDASLFASDYQEEVSKAEFTHYRLIGAALVSIISTWEQQLYEFVESLAIKRKITGKYKEDEIEYYDYEGSPIRRKVFRNEYNNIAELYFNEFKINIKPYEKTEQPDKNDKMRYSISKYRYLVNVIKHGQGLSFKFLKDHYGEYIKYNYYEHDFDGEKRKSDYRSASDNYEWISGRGLKIILNYSATDIEKCCDELIAFWKIKELSHEITQ